MIPEDSPKDRNGSSRKLAPGEYVEVKSSRAGSRRDVIEAVMKDKSGFWLAADGVEPRVFVPFEEFIVPLEDTEHSIRPATAPENA